MSEILENTPIEEVETQETVATPPVMMVGNVASGTAEEILPLRITSGTHSLTPLSSAEIKSLTAKTLVWNQLVRNGNFADGTTGWEARGNSTLSASNNEVTVTLTADASISYQGYIKGETSIKSGHKYYISLGVLASKTGNLIIDTSNAIASLALPVVAGIWHSVNIIREAIANSGRINLYPNEAVDGYLTGDYYKLRNVVIFDLTQMFGAGNEPSTVDEFKAMFPLPYYSYNAGTLLPFAATGLKTIGKNCWDEEWEVSTDHIVSKNYCEVIGGTDYYLKSSSALTFTWYDADKVQIGTYNANANSVVSVPANCAFYKFACPSSYGTLYNNDISIFLKYNDSTLTYSPYEAHTLSLPITTMKGKLNGAGASVVIFPNGMHGAGTAGDCFTDLRADGKFHKARKVMGRVDLGSLEWSYASVSSYFRASLRNTFSWNNIICSKYQTHGVSEDKSIALANDYFVVVKDTSYTDAATFKAAMNGVYAYYSIVTPEEYLLDEPIDASFFVNDGGTEQLLPANGAAPTTAPMYANIEYSATELPDCIFKTRPSIGDIVLKANGKIRFVTGADARQYATSKYPNIGVVYDVQGNYVRMVAPSGENKRWSCVADYEITAIPSASGSYAVTLSGASQGNFSYTKSAGTIAEFTTQLNTWLSNLPAGQKGHKWEAYTSNGHSYLVMTDYDEYEFVPLIGSTTLVKKVGSEISAYDTTFSRNAVLQQLAKNGLCRARLEDYVTSNATADCNPSSVMNGTTQLFETLPCSQAYYNGNNGSGLRAHFATYADYLDACMARLRELDFGVMKHREGKALTALLKDKTVLIGGNSAYAYEAARYCYDYNANVDGFGAGEWWLPSMYELGILMKNITGGTTKALDKVNCALTKTYGSKQIDADADHYSAERYDEGYVWTSDDNGCCGKDRFCESLATFPVTAFTLEIE